MNSTSNISFDVSNVLDDEDLQIDDFSDVSLHASPVKRTPKVSQTGSPTASSTSLTMSSFPDLRILANELFQVTHHLRSREGFDEPQKPLRDDKIEKLLDDLEEQNGDFELDDQLRTRVFRARLNKQPSDALDLKLDAFLQGKSLDALRRTRNKRANDENKENAPVPQTKKQKLSGRAKEKKSWSSIPSLQPLSNITDQTFNSPNRSPQRICVPRKLTPLRPCLRKLLQLPVQIYTVESLTGLINDATQFGTELNASNCEGFLMPDNIHEIVQIPTNEVGPSAKKKLAIIKAHYSKRFSKDSEEAKNEGSVGFYLKQEFENYRAPSTLKKQVQVHRDTKAVRWADELEW